MTTERTIITKRPPPRSEWPAWMTIAEQEVGVREQPGGADCARVIEYMRATRLEDKPHALHDSTAWCASFVCWCLEQAGYENPRYAMARNFLSYGEIVKPADAQFGDILVFRRGKDSAHAHVCFLVLDIEGVYYEVLGGNQKNSVCYSHECKGDLLGIRRPVQP